MVQIRFIQKMLKLLFLNHYVLWDLFYLILFLLYLKIYLVGGARGESVCVCAEDKEAIWGLAREISECPGSGGPRLGVLRSMWGNTMSVLLLTRLPQCLELSRKRLRLFFYTNLETRGTAGLTPSRPTGFLMSSISVPMHLESLWHSPWRWRCLISLTW